MAGLPTRMVALTAVIAAAGAAAVVAAVRHDAAPSTAVAWVPPASAARLAHAGLVFTGVAEDSVPITAAAARRALAVAYPAEAARILSRGPVELLETTRRSSSTGQPYRAQGWAFSIDPAGHESSAGVPATWMIVFVDGSGQTSGFEGN